MEKLIELLNEWSKTAIESKCNWTDVYDEEGVYFVNLFDRDMTMEIEDVISKRNGFIKWLVENEKIDSGTRNPLFITELVGEQEKQIPYSFYEEMLIRLAVSDTPIKDLISYLK